MVWAVTPAIVAAWWWTREPAALGAAPRCAGVLEILGAGALRTWPDAAVAGPVGVLGVVATVAALAVLAATVARLSGSWLSGAATGVACAAAPLWRPVLGLPDSLALVIAAGTAWGLAGLGDARARGTGWIRTGLIGAAAVAPPLLYGAALAQDVVGRHRSDTGRSARRVLWLVVSLAVPVAASIGAGGLPDAVAADGAGRCAWGWAPHPGTSALSALSALAGAAGVSLCVAALMALGLVDAALERRGAVRWVAGWLALPVIAILFGAEPSMRIAAPAVTVAWILTGLGLAAVERQVRRSRWPAAGATLATVLLVAVLVPARWPGAPALPARPMPEGHDRVTTSDIRALVMRLPHDAVLVREDALTDLHLRAISGRIARAGVNLRAVDAADVGTIDRGRRVFAWPHAQRALLLEGYRASDAGAFAADGLAELRIGGPCETLTREWRSTGALAQAPAVSLQAGTPDARGPVILWLSGPAPIDAARIDWPPAAWRGFHRIVYDLPGDAADANIARRDDGLPPVEAAPGAITRVEMWRTPDAPWSLTASLSAPPVRALIRLAPQGSGPLRLCPSFTWTVQPIHASATAQK